MLSNSPLLFWFIVVFLAGTLLWARRRRSRRREVARELAERVRREDALKHLCKCEANGIPATLASVAGILHLPADGTAELLGDMEQRGLVSFSSGELHLTPTGRASGLHIIRAHRLWESYLAGETGVEKNAWHAQAEEREHSISPAEADRLSARLGHPVRDPHGDEIPRAGGALSADPGRPLTTLAPGTAGRIVHLEDEPEIVHAQLVAEGLRLGAVVEVVENSDRRMRFWAEGDEHVLAPLLAHNVDVLPFAPDEAGRTETTLSDLKPGAQATVLGLMPDCRGQERQRLLDLGFVPGTKVASEMTSPTGEPTAYRVRDSLIALRREQARHVRVRVPAADAAPPP